MITVPLAGCFGGDDDDSADAPIQELDDWNVHFAATAADLPDCDEVTNGRLYYVEADNEFQACTSSGWQVISIQGAAGQDGVAGTDGIDGQAGIDGLDGNSILITVSQSSSCSNGGNTFNIGPDSNGNGFLEAAEYVMNVDVCDGSEGQQGPQGPPGVNGTDGQDAFQNLFSTTSISPPEPNILALTNHTSYNNSISELTEVVTSSGEKIIFFISPISNSGAKALWRTDGTVAGTSIVEIFHNGWGIGHLTEYNGQLYFSYGNGSSDPQTGLWVSDGTLAGTNLAVNFGSSGSYSSPYAHLSNQINGLQQSKSNGFIILNQEMYFVANDGIHGNELWKSDGTLAGTSMVKDINSGSSSSNIGAMVKVGNEIFFRADDSANPGSWDNSNLWKSDGTEVGTVMVKDTTSSPSYLFDFNGLLIFKNGYNGKLWKSDGTNSGTVKLTDITGNYFVEMNNQLYFVGYDGAYGHELWKSDGTTAGTMMVKDINQIPSTANSPTDTQSSMYGWGQQIYEYQNLLYFEASDGIHGSELWRSDGTEAGTTMLKDINPGSSDSPSSPSNFISVNNLLYFNANDGINGMELWATDGTYAGTNLVYDINSGTEGSEPYGTEGSRMSFGSDLYFAAYDSSVITMDGYWMDNIQLWVLKGNVNTDNQCDNGGVEINSGLDTNQNGLLDSDEITNTEIICNGAQGPQGQPGMNGQDGADGQDGSQGPMGPQGPNGTNGADGQDGSQGPMGPQGPNGSDGADGQDGSTALIETSNEPAGNNCANGGVKIEAGVDDNGNGQLDANEVDSTQYVCDGGSSTTTMLTSYSTPPTSMGCDVGGSVIAHGLDNGDGGGTAANGQLESGEVDYSTTFCTKSTLLRIDIYPGINSGYTSYLTIFNNDLYFRAYDETNGEELWKYDGVNAPSMVADIRPGNNSSSPSELTVFNNELYFVAYDGTNGHELWKYDGTNAPSMVADIRPGSTGSYPSDLTVFNNALYFEASDGTYGSELWKYNGTNPPSMVADIRLGFDGSFPSYLTVFNNELYFLGSNGVNGSELWKYNGTNPPSMVADIRPGSGSSSPRHLTVFNNELYFQASDGTYGAEFWKYDGVNAPSMVADMFFGSGGSYPDDLTVFNNELYFQAYSIIYGYELWKYDGTNSPSMVSDIYSGSTGSYPSDLTVFNDELYFRATDGTNGQELWKYDGTNAPSMVADIYSGSSSSYPFALTVFNNELCFTADDGTNGYELWKYSQQTTVIYS